MTTDRVVSAAVALICIVAMGVSATTLDSSLSSDPDEIVDLDYDSLPLAQDQAREVKDEVERNERSQQSAGGGGGGGEDGPSEPPWWTWLLALLERLLPYLVGALCLVVALALGRRYAARLLALLAAFVPAGDESPSDPDAEWVARPANEVERAWLSLVERAGVDAPRTKTTAECARAAVDAGFDAAAVRDLRDAYDRVRYGGADPAEVDLGRLRRDLDRVDGAAPSGGVGRPGVPTRADGGDSA
ncbi:DUF4129 domain-containing protein [Halomarina ordinaria]|uniref:DUF4129 domain-containing protein n=1 Tax=Halomarina ordinaria TaxID=3033939 RepID=A0ABD5UHV3_9EURY|nr:DUF4129 domain-containing protein [Halomarina sp. PSRA2]